MDGETLQQKTTHIGRKNSQLQDLQWQEGGAKWVLNISEQIQDTTGHYGTKVFYMCGVAHILRTHQGKSDRAPVPANDVAAL